MVSGLCLSVVLVFKIKSLNLDVNEMCKKYFKIQCFSKNVSISKIHTKNYFQKPLCIILPALCLDMCLGLICLKCGECLSEDFCQQRRLWKKKTVWVLFSKETPVQRSTWGSFLGTVCMDGGSECVCVVLTYTQVPMC